MGNSASFVELEEDKMIGDAIQIEPVANIPGRFKLSLEYPVQPGVDLAYIYSAAKSNRYMARTSSESLRKKLLRDKKLEAFHAKVWEGVTKKQFTLIDLNVRLLTQACRCLIS